MKKLFLVLIAYYWLLPCFGQNMYTNFTNDIAVNGMAQEGPFLWFATKGGLFKYDTLTGNTTRFDITNSPIYDNEFSTVKIAGNGKKVLVPFSGLFQTYDDNTGWTPVCTDTAGNDFDAIGDSKGRLWVTAAGSVLFFNGQQWQSLREIAGIQLSNGDPFCSVDYNTNTAWIYLSGLDKLFKCDSNNNWYSYQVPGFQSNNRLYNRPNWQSNFVFNYNSAFYILNQPAGLSDAPAFLKLENGYWTSPICPLIHDANDYLIHLQAMPDGSVRISHCYVNEITGAYYYGVYVFNSGTWTEENPISGTFPFEKDSTNLNYAFIDADASGNMYYAYGFDPNNYGPKQHNSGLWKLSPANLWTRVGIGNITLESNWLVDMYLNMDTAGIIYAVDPNNQLSRIMPDNSVVNSVIGPCMDSVSVIGAVLDSSNNIWLSQVNDHNGIQYYLVNTSTCSVYPLGRTSIFGMSYYKGNIYGLGQDSARNSSIIRFNISTGSFYFTPFTPPPQWTVGGYNYQTLIPHDTDIYIYGDFGTPDVGSLDVYRLGEWQTIFPTLNIEGVAFDTLGRLWTSTSTNVHGGGIGTTVVYMFDGTEWHNMGGFPGNAWSTNSISVGKKNVITFWTDSGTYQYYDSTWHSFQPMPSFMFAAAMFSRNDGTIAFPMAQDGLVIFTPPVSVTPVTNDDFSLVAYPDPNTGQFYIRFSQSPTNTYTIKIFDVTGKLVWQGENNTTETAINCRSLSSGVYVYQVVLNGRRATGKIVVL